MNLTIMIADDDQDDVMIFTDVLSEVLQKNYLSFKLNVAKNGADLMQQLQGTDELPQILFLDINMPLKDGLTCLAEIKTDEKFKDIIVIMLSTSTLHSHIRRAYECGADLYISKSTSYGEFKQAISSCFSADGQFIHKLGNFAN